MLNYLILICLITRSSLNERKKTWDTFEGTSESLLLLKNTLGSILFTSTQAAAFPSFYFFWNQRLFIVRLGRFGTLLGQNSCLFPDRSEGLCQTLWSLWGENEVDTSEIHRRPLKLTLCPRNGGRGRGTTTAQTSRPKISSRPDAAVALWGINGIDHSIKRQQELLVYSKNTQRSTSNTRGLFLLKPAAAPHTSSPTIKLSSSDGRTISSRHHQISGRRNSFGRFSVSLSFAASSMALVRPREETAGRKRAKEKSSVCSFLHRWSRKKKKKETSQGKSNNTRVNKCASVEFTRSWRERICCRRVNQRLSGANWNLTNWLNEEVKAGSDDTVPVLHAGSPLVLRVPAADEHINSGSTAGVNLQLLLDKTKVAQIKSANWS